MKAFLISSAVLLLGCGGGSYVHSDTTLGRVIVYRNGVAYFERAARIDKDTLRLSVPADKVDDFLKSLTVVDARTGDSAPIEYPTVAPSSDTGLIEMNIRLLGARPHQVKLSYVTEAPAWKPSYRVTLDKAGKVKLEGLAIVDNTSGEDWSKVALGVASSSALSFRFDLRSVRFIQRETLTPSDMFAVAPPLGGSPYGGEPPGERGKALSVDLSDEDLGGAARYLPHSEQLVQSSAALSRIDAARSNVRRMLEIARRERDVVKTLCLNDKLTQLEVGARSAGERKASLERATSGNDVDVASHEFTVISVLKQRADQLAAEANQCIGQEAAFVGETRVTTTIDPNLPPDEDDRRAAPLPRPAPPSPRPAQPPASPPPPPPAKPPPQKQAIDSLAARIKASRRRVVIEGYAGARDGDKPAASLDRASKVRDQLIQRGVDPDRIAAVGKGVHPGHGAGVRLVELPSAAEDEILNDAALAEKAAGAAPPIGAAHFESKAPMSVAHGASTMVSMFKAETEGEIVYLYDRESARGNEAYPFRAVRLRNPTGEALESGPVTVFGEGRFIGEGLSDPIPARSVAFVPFSLDRQIVAQRKETERDEIARVLSARRGVFSVEVRHIRRASVTLHNRLAEPVTVYVRHTVAPGFELGAAPASRERIGAAYLFRVALPASGDAEVMIEESTPQSKVIDVRQEAGMALWRAYLTTAEAAPARKQGLHELMQRTDEIDELEQRIATTREQMKEYRERTFELSQQVVSLRAVSAKGGASGPLLKHLEQALRETNDKLSQATIELVSLEEKRMIARIRREEALSQASLKWTGSASGNDGQRPREALAQIGER